MAEHRVRKAAAEARIAALKLSKPYRTSFDNDTDERGVLRFRAGRPSVKDGVFRGTELVFCDAYIDVWTSKTKMLRQFCSRLRIHMVELTREATARVPLEHVQDLLTCLKAQYRAVLSPEARKAVSERLAIMRLARFKPGV